MGGKSSSTQEQTQSSTTAPWAAAQPALQGILGQLNGQLGNTGLTGAESGALNSISANGQNQFAPQINSLASVLFGGGGANDQAGNINSALKTYQDQTNPLASNTDYNPMNTPGFRDAVSTMTNDITGNINGMFAGAGRDFSGAHAQALSRGIAQGVAPTIASQYNANVANQQGAAGNLYSAGNTTSGLLSGLNQQDLTNRTAGVGIAQSGLDATNSGANATLQAEAARRGIPAQALGLLAQIGIPIAGLGSQTEGKGTATGTQQMSGAQQFATIAGGAANLGRLLFSDVRLKEDVEQVGALFDGTPVYRYRYTGHKAFQLGLLAHEIETRSPEAVASIGGYKAVDYKLATDKALERR